MGFVSKAFSSVEHAVVGEAKEVGRDLKNFGSNLAKGNITGAAQSLKHVCDPTEVTLRLTEATQKTLGKFYQDTPLGAIDPIGKKINGYAGSAIDGAKWTSKKIDDGVNWSSTYIPDKLDAQASGSDWYYMHWFKPNGVSSAVASDMTAKDTTPAVPKK